MRQPSFCRALALAAVLSATGAAAFVPNVCEIISGRDVAEATGLKVTRIVHTATPKLAPHRKSICRFYMDTGVEGLRPTITVQVTERLDAADMKFYYEQNVHAGSGGRRAERVRGLGDEAYWMSAPLRQIFVRRDRFSLVIQSVPQADEKGREQARRMAELIVPKLVP